MIWCKLLDVVPSSPSPASGTSSSKGSSSTSGSYVSPPPGLASMNSRTIRLKIELIEMYVCVILLFICTKMRQDIFFNLKIIMVTHHLHGQTFCCAS